MNKYKIGKYVIDAESPVKAMKIAKVLDSSIKDDRWWFEQLKPGDRIYLEYRENGRRLMTDPDNARFQKLTNNSVIITNNGKTLEIPLNSIALRQKDSKMKDSNISNAYSEIKRFYPTAELFATTKNGMGAIVVKNAGSLGSGIKQFLTNINKKYGRPHAGFGGRPTDEIEIVGNEAIVFINDSTTKDAAFNRSTVDALIADEQAAIAAYNVAIANLKGKLSDEAIKVLQVIRDDEQNHVANLNAILSNNITEKNLEDSAIRDEYEYVLDYAKLLHNYAENKDYKRVASLCEALLDRLKRDKLS